MLKRLLLTAALLCLALPAGADEIRSWVDADGVRHFGDSSAAPGHSDRVELSEGSYLEMEAGATAGNPYASGSSAAGSASASAPARSCTPLIEEVVDPRSGIHSQRDTGRCQEDGPVEPDPQGYPYYVWGTPANPCLPRPSGGAYPAPGCVRPPHPPRPHPPLPAPTPQPVKPWVPQPFNQTPLNFKR